MAISFTIEGDRTVERRLMRAKVRSKKIGPKAERKWAFRLKAEVRASASRFKKTGAYDRSIVVRNGNEVLTMHPAGPRLEKGFVGVDSLGRFYAQAPQEHWGPSRRKVAKLMAADLKKEAMTIGD